MPEYYQPSIERLPLATQSNLRSTQILTSFPQIVSELLQNSLDASATHIEVGLDLKEWMCWIRDNGHGISKDELEYLGGGAEGGRYNTSKTYAPGSNPTFGFRGEALASAADISCLEICSRNLKSRNTWSIILKGSKVLYKGPAVRWKRESPGTTVCIRDAFYNLPVRRLSHTPPSRTWDLVRKEIETYSLMFFHVSFTLEDTSRTGNPSQHIDHTFRIPKSTSTLGVFKHLYGYALTQHIEEVDVTYGNTKIEGFISLTGASSKVYQFLCEYINRHPITNSDLGRVIESQFASSSFGKNALDEEGETDLPRSTIRRSPRKAEKKPIYVLNISIPPGEVDNCLDPSKTMVELRNKTNVISHLSSTIQSFLKKHGFLIQNQSALKPTNLSAASPKKRRKLDLDDSGYAEVNSISDISVLCLQDDSRASRTSVSGDLYTSAEGISEEIPWTDPSTRECFLVDSRTGNSIRQTGIHPRAVNDDSNIASTGQPERRTLGQLKAQNLARTTSDPSQSSVPAWLAHALERNQAYTTTENRIPATNLLPGSYQIPLNHCYDGHDSLRGQECGYQTLQNVTPYEKLKAENITSMHETSAYQFTRDDIRHAEIINQVDRKFIACSIVKRSNGTTPHERDDLKSKLDAVIVLIDQHAADERIRVERFLTELFLGSHNSQDRTESNPTGYVRSMELNPPRPVLLTQHEALTINGSQDAREVFQKWGVRFVELSKVMADSDGASRPGSIIGYSQILVSSIPEVVGDKLLQADELRDFIKGFLGQIQCGELFPDPHLDFPPGAGQDEFLWFKAVRQCPRGLLDLINSKACRGAIMFNDPLSVSQCEILVKQLSETVFPFQCAHGRPSLVPLCDSGLLQATPHKRTRNRRSDWTRIETMADA